MSVIFDKIKEIKEKYVQKEADEETVKREIARLNNELRMIEGDKLILKGSYDSLIEVGVKIGEFSVDENGRITLLDNEE